MPCSLPAHYAATEYVPLGCHAPSQHVNLFAPTNTMPSAEIPCQINLSLINFHLYYNRSESVTLKAKLQAQLCVKYIAETSEFDGLMVK